MQLKTQCILIRNELGLAMNSNARRVEMLVAQWAAASFILILLVMPMTAIALQRRADGLDVTGFFIAIALMAGVAILLSPPAYFRLPAKGKAASYGLVLPVLVAVIWTYSIVDEAYKRTPKGVREAAREQELARRVEENEERQKGENALKESLQYIAETQRKVQACINWQGQIPSLVRVTKDALHNPRSFEHVRTEMRLIGEDQETSLPGVVMEYQAENGFGAIRKNAVSAFIAPDDCSVRSIKEYEPSDFQ